MGRALVATGLLSAWLVLLFSGVALGGAVHLLLLAALVTYPWRVALAADDEPEEPTP
jgi:hypothetical protein